MTDAPQTTDYHCDTCGPVSGFCAQHRCEAQPVIARRSSGYSQEDGPYDWQDDGPARRGPPPDELTRDEVVARLRKMADFERFKAAQTDGRRSLLAGVKDDAEKNAAALHAAIAMLEGMDRD